MTKPRVRAIRTDVGGMLTPLITRAFTSFGRLAVGCEGTMT
jgi:hypothetical protein